MYAPYAKKKNLNLLKPWKYIWILIIKKQWWIEMKVPTRWTILKSYWWQWRIKKSKWCLCFWKQVDSFKPNNLEEHMIKNIKNSCKFLGLKLKNLKKKLKHRNWKVSLNFYFFKNLNNLEEKWREINSFEENLNKKNLNNKPFQNNSINQTITTKFLVPLLKIPQNI